MVSQDYEDLFNVLNAHNIKYLVVGAHAFAFHATPRFTKDLDVWIPPALNDAAKVYGALKAFGTLLRDLTVKDFADTSTILQIGVAPVRIDIMGDVPGVSWQQAWTHRRSGRYGKAAIHVLGRAELIQAKQTAGRPQDQLDLAHLLLKKKSRT